MICSFDGCEKVVIAKGYCPGHYSQLREGRQLKPLRVAKYNSIEDMFTKSKIHDDCILWTGLTDKVGYGRLCFRGKTSTLAHRAAYMLATGEDITGVTIHHTCANKACINPEHLQPAKHADNVLEMLARKDYEAEIARLQLRVIELEAELERATTWQV